MSNSWFESLQEAVNSRICGGYRLPVFKGKKVFYIVPMSGGLDSFCVAYTMMALFPEQPLTFVHCDTGIEAKGTDVALARFEKSTGKKIIRISHKDDMLTMIEKSGNFLPSQRQRSCTQMMKTLPSKRFFEQLRSIHGEDVVFCQLVGIRADEPKRTGIQWSEPYIASAFPLQGLGITKADVNNIVKEVAEIPSYYREKSRSGCTVCIFSRRSEIINAWQTSPDILERAAAMEGIQGHVLEVYNALPETVSDITGCGRNWLAYYRPSNLVDTAYMPFEGKRGKNKIRKDVPDLFGGSEARKLYVAVEYEYENRSDLMMAIGMSGAPMIYSERIITYSTSLSGITTALKHFWTHRVLTKEIYDNSEADMRRERQIQILEVEVDDFDSEIPPKPDDGSYTWQNDKKPLYSIRKTHAVIERILLSEGVRQLAKSKDSYTRYQYKDALAKVDVAKEYGRILSSIPYQKKELSELIGDPDVADEPVACMTCSR